MKQFIGIGLIVLGALMLIISYFQGDLVDYNWYNVSALFIIIAGIVAHIQITRRLK